MIISNTFVQSIYLSNLRSILNVTLTIKRTDIHIVRLLFM